MNLWGPEFERESQLNNFHLISILLKLVYKNCNNLDF